MSDPSPWLKEIRRMPRHYLDSKSLTALYNYLKGYRFALSCHGNIPDRLGLTVPDDFADWVAYRTHHGCTDHEWLRPLIKTSSSEEEAFDRFFVLWAEYWCRVPTLVADIIGSDPPPCEPWQEPIPAPEKIQLVKYTVDPGCFVLFGGNPHYRDGFCPAFHTWGLSGGEWIIHDEAAYQQLLSDDEAWRQKFGARGQ